VRPSHASLLLDLGLPPEGVEGDLTEDLKCFAFMIELEQRDFSYTNIINYLRNLELPEGLNSYQQRDIRRKNQPYTLIGDEFYLVGKDGILRRVVNLDEAVEILRHCHEGVCGGHFATGIASRKILQACYYWPSLFADSTKYCRTYQSCQC